MKAPKFKEFISEAKNNKKYKLLIITDKPEKAKTFHTANRLQEEAEKLGWKSYLYRLSGGYTSYEDSIFKLHNKEDEKVDVIFLNVESATSLATNRFPNDPVPPVIKIDFPLVIIS